MYCYVKFAGKEHPTFIPENCAKRSRFSWRCMVAGLRCVQELRPLLAGKGPEEETNCRRSAEPPMVACIKLVHAISENVNFRTHSISTSFQTAGTCIYVHRTQLPYALLLGKLLTETAFSSMNPDCIIPRGCPPRLGRNGLRCCCASERCKWTV